MFHFLLLFVYFFADASLPQYFLTLTDKSGELHKIGLDIEDLELFPTLQRGVAYNQTNELTWEKEKLKKSETLQRDVAYNKINELQWDYDDLSYESFAYILRPLCKELKTFNDSSLSMRPDQILQSPGLLEDTKNVLQWIYQKAKQKEKNNTIDDFINDVVQAFDDAAFLQLPFGIRRGLYNYLYDVGVADQIINSQDLAVNSSEWLISNQDFSPSYPMMQSGKYRIVVFMAKQFRFFDGIKAIEDVQRVVQYQFFLCFDFQYNKIQHIDLEQLRTHVNPMFKDAKEGKPVFDFRQNPLSDDTKNAIAQSGQEEYIQGFEVGFDEQINRFNKDMDAEQQALTDNTLLHLSNNRKFRFLTGAISIASFGVSYLASSKVFRQSVRKSLMHGFGSLLFLSPFIFYLYKNKKKIFGLGLADKEINRKRFLINNYKEQIEKLKQYKENSTLKFKSFLIDNLFYIFYSDNN